MRKKTLVSKLRQAQRTIDEAIRWVDADMAREDPEPYEVARCIKCGESIYSDQESIRAVHRECYNWLNDNIVRKGLGTWEDLERQGKVGPRGRPGPKSKGNGS